MDISLLSICHTMIWDFHPGMAQGFANALKNAMELHVSGADNNKKKQQGFFLSTKRSVEDKLYVGNIHRIENHLYWNDEKLADDDEIINVVVIDGPVTRDGGACSYGSKDHRDQVMYANTIPQVKAHLFLINTPGGEAAARYDYEMAFADCHEKGKPTVAFIDGLCASMGVNISSRCDYTIVMNPKDDFGCIGSMAAFWATPDGAIDRDGSRYVEIVGDGSPEKNAWWREAAEGEYKKLKERINKSTMEFHQSVRENRPLVKDWMLNGEIFKAQDVIPALVDEIGDMNRAIEVAFELVNGTITPAREVTVVTDEPTEGPVATQDTQEEKVINPQNDNNMTEEEKKAEEVAEQPATTQEEHAPATEQPAEEAPATEAPTVEEKPAEEETPAQEETPNSNSPEGGEQSQEEATGQAEALATAEALVAERDKEIATLKENLATLEGIKDERDQRDKELATALADIARNDKTIEAHVATIAERDKTIAEHVATIAAKGAVIAEKDALIEKLTKQTADLKAEVKELSEKPTPMVSAESGVPADNSTGDAPKVNQHQRIKPGMSYKEIRRIKKEEKK